MKSLKYLFIGFLMISLTACGGTETVVETNDTPISNETESTASSETKVAEITEPEEITDLGLDNALLELDLVE
jgi:hypothetical protein